MSHEIRTPMNAIVGMGELLEHEELTPRQRGYVTDIVVSAGSLLRIINDILDFSKIEAGSFELDPVDYDFIAQLDNIESMFTHVACKRALEFKAVRAKDLPRYLYGDDLRLRQTLNNIIGNAVKYTEKGGVTFQTMVKEGNLVFQVKDTGIGIREEDIQTLFSAFAQFDRTKNRYVVGTGLGLAISDSYVRMMGGNIAVESEYGKGTTFTITIPYVEGDKDRITDIIRDREHSTIYAPDAQVLVVDDNEFNIRVALGLLNLHGIKADAVDSGAKAIEAVAAKDYDIVFMDQMMPEMDGVEATARIRKLDEKYGQLPIIALTANAITGAKDFFLSTGFDDFISKPIDTRELVRVLKEWLPAERISIPPVMNAEADVRVETQTGEKTGFLAGMRKNGDIDIELGLKRAMGMEEMYRDSVMFFTNKMLGECKKMSSALEMGDLKSFTIEIHTMKSALSTIGAMRFAEVAQELESSGLSGDLDYCLQHYPPLEKSLFGMYEQLAVLFVEKAPRKRESGDQERLREVVIEALAAAEDADSDLGMELLEELTKSDFGTEANELLTQAMAAFEDFDCDLAAEKLRRIG
jgi:CheY-like chemotaxis protein/HPt (histidine-containing phosphotransfer) domain-containing protein